MSECRYVLVRYITLTPKDSNPASLSTKLNRKIAFFVYDTTEKKLMLPVSSNGSFIIRALNRTSQMAAFPARLRNIEGKWVCYTTCPETNPTHMPTRGAMKEAEPYEFAYFTRPRHTDDYTCAEIFYRAPDVNTGTEPAQAYCPEAHSFGTIHLVSRAELSPLLADSLGTLLKPDDDCTWTISFLKELGLHARIIDLSMDMMR